MSTVNIPPCVLKWELGPDDVVRLPLSSFTALCGEHNRFEASLVQGERAVRACLETMEHGSNRGPVFDARVLAYAFLRRSSPPVGEKYD